jgi:hypothetical protein
MSKNPTITPVIRPSSAITQNRRRNGRVIKDPNVPTRIMSALLHDHDADGCTLGAHTRRTLLTFVRVRGPAKPRARGGLTGGFRVVSD